VTDTEVQPHQLVRFAHNSERQFAKLLDHPGQRDDVQHALAALEQVDDLLAAGGQHGLGAVEHEVAAGHVLAA